MGRSILEQTRSRTTSVLLVEAEPDLPMVLPWNFICSGLLQVFSLKFAESESRGRFKVWATGAAALDPRVSGDPVLQPLKVLKMLVFFFYLIQLRKKKKQKKHSEGPVVQWPSRSLFFNGETRMP